MLWTTYPAIGTFDDEDVAAAAAAAAADDDDEDDEDDDDLTSDAKFTLPNTDAYVANAAARRRLSASTAA